MAVKAACIAAGVQSEAGGKFKLIVYYAGMDTGNPVDNALVISGLTGSLTSLQLEQTVKDAVKDELINNHSYTFGLLDSVRLLGALI